MKALNKNERNSAIIRFSLWLLVSVLIISVPVILTSYVSAEQRSIEAGKNKDLIRDINFEKEFMADRILNIKTLMEKKEAKKIDVDSFNAELMNLVSDIKKQTDTISDWRGEMYLNMAAISEYLVSANKIMSTSADSKEKMLSELNKIILDIETISEKITDLSDQKKKKDIQKGLDDADEQLKRAVKMLNNYKSQIK